MAPEPFASDGDQTVERPDRCAIAVVAGIAFCAIEIVILFVLMTSHGIDLLISGPFVASAGFFIFVVYGAVLHFVAALFRKRAKLYWKRTFRDPRWLGITALLAINLGMLSYFYQGLKTGTWLMGRSSVDSLLWAIDRFVFFGMSPNIFFLNLFDNPVLLGVFDLGYGMLFLIVLILGIASYLAMPGFARRTSFILANTLLWSAGAWLYFAVPAMGPAYGFSDVWEQARPGMPASTHLQRRLIENHLNVLARNEGLPGGRIRFAEGLGAFPSLHVGLFALLALFVRRESRRGGNWLFGATAFMFLGSIITGWHYMIDSVAGLILAWLSYRVILWLEPRWAPLTPAAEGP